LFLFVEFCWHVVIPRNIYFSIYRNRPRFPSLLKPLNHLWVKFGGNIPCVLFFYEHLFTLCHLDTCVLNTIYFVFFYTHVCCLFYEHLSTLCHLDTCVLNTIYFVFFYTLVCCLFYEHLSTLCHLVTCVFVFWTLDFFVLFNHMYVLFFVWTLLCCFI
jgi:hypothetical protein